MLAYCSVGFFVFGFVIVLLGSNQAEMARSLGLDLAQSGMLQAALAAGVGAGLVAGGPLFDRLPRRPLFAGSTLLAGAGLLSIGPEIGFPRALATFLGFGFGCGVYDTLISAVVAERFRERAARPMALVHAAATAGAVCGPPLLGWLAAQGGWTASFRAVGAAHLVLAAAAWTVRFSAPATREERRAGGGCGLSAAILPIAAIGFAYVGVEASVTLFSVPYATSALGLPEERGLFAISAFWTGLLLGRLGVSTLHGPGVFTLIAAGLLGAAGLGAGVLARVAAIELFFAAVGIAIGCVYPLMVSVAGQCFPRARGTAAGLVGGAGALGGATIPWLTGGIGDAAGIAAAFGTLALWALVIAAGAAIAAAPQGRLRS